MNWNRAKNIILLILVVTNVFLGIYLGYMRITERNMFREAAEGTVQVLKSRGIELDIGLITNEDDDRRLYVIERDQTAEQSIAQTLLEDAKTSGSGGTDHYLSDNGSVSWMTGGFTEGEITANAQFAAAAFVSSDSGVTVRNPDGTLTITQEIKKLPVFNCAVTLTDSDAGCTFSGRYCTGTPIPVNDSRPMSVTSILIKYSSDVSGQVVSRITDIDRGWAVQTLPGIGVRLIPVFRITADTAVTYMNAIDGSVVLAE